MLYVRGAVRSPNRRWGVTFLAGLSLLSVLSASLLAHAGDPAPLSYDAASALRKQLGKLESVPGDEVLAAYQRIRDRILTVRPRWAYNSFLPLMANVAVGIAFREAVYYLTEETRKTLNVPNEICHPNDKAVLECNKLVAFYIPVLHAIFIDRSLKDVAFERSLFHELVHAYQYTYRLPLDAAYAYGLVKAAAGSGVTPIAEGQFNDYLSFFYETQANWYTLTLFRDREWVRTGRSFWSLIPMSMLKATGAAASAGLTLKPGNRIYNKYVPVRDQLSDHEGQLAHYRGEQLQLSELIVFRMRGKLFNPSVNFDLGFHVRFSKAVETGYFGKLPFLGVDGNVDQLRFVDMHNRYYHLIADAPAETVALCGKAYFITTPVMASPMLEWFNRPLERHPVCPLTDYPEFYGDRAEILRLITQYRETSPFILGPAGGEGGGKGDFSIKPPRPSYLPQLAIEPPKKQEKAKAPKQKKPRKKKEGEPVADEEQIEVDSAAPAEPMDAPLNEEPNEDVEHED